MVDRNLVLRKIAELEAYLGQIKEFSGISLSDYKADWKAQRIVERTLQIMIETCIDIANHVISDSGMRIPENYSDAFRVLLENKAIDEGLFAIMDKMAKFRNVVVHQYETVDTEIVMTILKKHLGDFVKFKEAILSYLETCR